MLIYCAGTPKTTPNFITPSVTPPNEIQYSTNSSLESTPQPPSASNQFTFQPFVPTSKTVTSFLPTQSSISATQSLDVPLATRLTYAPQVYALRVERMHIGAKHQVILDMGRLVLLTDVHQPICADLLSLAIDVALSVPSTAQPFAEAAWDHSSQQTSSAPAQWQRLVFSYDICEKPLFLADLEPPVLCRYVRLTLVGRCPMSGGSSSTRLRSLVALGCFLGYDCPLPADLLLAEHSSPPHASASTTDAVQQQRNLIAQFVVPEIAETFSTYRANLEASLERGATVTRNGELSSSSSSAATTKKAEAISFMNLFPSLLPASASCSGGPDVSSSLSIVSQLLVWRRQLVRALNLQRRLERHLCPSRIADAEVESEKRSLKSLATDKLRFAIERLLALLLNMTGMPSAPSLALHEFTSGVQPGGLFVATTLLNALGEETLQQQLAQQLFCGTKLSQVFASALLTRFCVFLHNAHSAVNPWHWFAKLVLSISKRASSETSRGPRLFFILGAYANPNTNTNQDQTIQYIILVNLLVRTLLSTDSLFVLQRINSTRICIYSFYVRLIEKI